MSIYKLHLAERANSLILSRTYNESDGFKLKLTITFAKKPI